MTQLTLEMPESAFATMHKDPKEFTRELRIALAVKWYELELLSQGVPPKLPGSTRAGSLLCWENTKSALFSTLQRKCWRIWRMRIETGGHQRIALGHAVSGRVASALRRLQAVGLWISELLIAKLAQADTRGTWHTH